MADGIETVDFLLVEGFSALAFFSAVEPLRVANRIAGRTIFAWRLHAEDGAPVAASSGMRFPVDRALAEVTAPGTLIVCAGFRPDKAIGRAGLATLRRFAHDGGRLGALDTGVEILARAGVAGRGPVAIHWEAAPEFRERWADIPVTDALYAIGERVFTCAGGTAALDMMLERLADSHGRAFAHAVSEQFIHDRIRRAGEAQRMALDRRLAVRNRAVVGVIAVMEAHLDAPLASPALAARAGLSVRQVERLFDTHLGMAPQDYYRRLRVERARALIETTDLKVLDIALATGFDSASALARVFRRTFGTSPASLRKQSPSARP